MFNFALLIFFCQYVTVRGTVSSLGSGYYSIEQPSANNGRKWLRSGDIKVTFSYNVQLGLILAGLKRYGSKD